MEQTKNTKKVLNKKKQSKVFVVIPCHNEEKNIYKLVKEVKKYCSNIIVADDNSQDRTLQEALRAKAWIVTRKNTFKKGKGKGFIARVGCNYAVQKGAEKIIIMDGDFQHKPSEIPKFLEELTNNDLVLSHRKWDENMPFKAKLGNWGVNLWLNVLFWIKLKDSQSGFKAFTKETYEKIKWTADDYFMETEIALKIKKKGLVYSQIPIQTIYLDAKKGTSWSHGFSILKQMFKWRFKLWFNK